MATARLPSIDTRWACVRLSLRPAIRCGMSRLRLAIQLGRGGLVQLGGGGQIRLVGPGAALGCDEAAERQALLHLVEALLAEVSHSQQLIVAECQQLPDLGDVVALQAVAGALREVALLDGR